MRPVRLGVKAAAKSIAYRHFSGHENAELTAQFIERAGRTCPSAGLRLPNAATQQDVAGTCWSVTKGVGAGKDDHPSPAP